jgi:hypothetical protein
MTPLIAAACDSYESVVRVLLESPRVDVFARDSYVSTSASEQNCALPRNRDELIPPCVTSGL